LKAGKQDALEGNFAGEIIVGDGGKIAAFLGGKVLVVEGGWMRWGLGLRHQ
jgi:hypothetical protein